MLKPIVARRLRQESQSQHRLRLQVLEQRGLQSETLPKIKIMNRNNLAYDPIAKKQKQQQLSYRSHMRNQNSGVVWFGFRVRVSYTSDWSQTHYYVVVKDDLELLNLGIPSPECCDHRQVPRGRDLTVEKTLKCFH